jgi:hypothetical protein
LFEEKQKRNAMQNTSEVVKRLMEAEQQIDDLRLAVNDMHDVSNHLEVESIFVSLFSPTLPSISPSSLFPLPSFF